MCKRIKAQTLTNYVNKSVNPQEQLFLYGMLSVNNAIIEIGVSIMPYIFVYGTLMEGEKYYSIISPFVISTRPAYVKGRLCHLPYGYPMLFFPGDDVVRGELVQVNNERAALKSVDLLEDYYGQDNPHNLYSRRRVSVFVRKDKEKMAWVYTCPDNDIERMWSKGIYLSHGDWKYYLKTGNKETLNDKINNA
jgi:gamma-glutamylcyclotransferase (GGCT)/AIG2-like uncharacterized protein YtfP